MVAALSEVFANPALNPLGGKAARSLACEASLTFASWNRIGEWLRRLEALRRVA